MPLGKFFCIRVYNFRFYNSANLIFTHMKLGCRCFYCFCFFLVEIFAFLLFVKIRSGCETPN